MTDVSFLLMPSFGRVFDVSSLTNDYVLVFKAFFPCVVMCFDPECKFYFVWKDVSIHAVQKPQKPMGRHMHVSQNYHNWLYCLNTSKISGEHTELPRIVR